MTGARWRAWRDAAIGLPASVGALAVRLRLAVVGAWALIAVLATLFLPGIGDAGSDLGLPVPEDAAAIRAQEGSFETFGFPLISRTMVVQRNAAGLPDETLEASARQASRVSLGLEEGFDELSAAVPVIDDLPLPDRPRARPTTVVTYLLFTRDVSAGLRTTLAERYAKRLGGARADVVGVTGTVPARREMVRLIEQSLPWVTLATALLVAFVVGLVFRAVGPSVVALLAIAVSHLIAVRLVGWVSEVAGIAVPSEAEPVIVVLLFGIVTDYSIFFLFAARARLRAGADRLSAARGAVGEVSHVVAAAGLTVTAGTAALMAAQLSFFRSFGPALAISGAVATVVVLTFIPAVLALGGKLLFWPTVPRPGHALTPPSRAARGVRRAVVSIGRTLVRRPPVARGVAAGILVALLGAGLVGLGTELDPTVIRALPPGAEPVRAAAAAGEGFEEGIVSPMVVLVRGAPIDAARAAALQREIAARPGVGVAIGPGTARALGLGISPQGAFIRPDTATARFLVLLDSDPLAPRAIARLRDLQGALPEMLRRSGLDGAEATIAGDTAVASEAMDAASRDLFRVGAVASLALLVLLAITLGSLAMPLILLGVNLLALAATLGLTTLVVQVGMGDPGLQYFVPFACSILLLALGSDYSIYLVRRVWDLGEERGVPAGLARAFPRSTGAIALAGAVLAGSFALLWIVPIDPFRQFAIAMVIGISLTAFVVPLLLVPSIIALLGARVRWPARGSPQPPAPARPEPPRPAPGPAGGG